jgi:hypothetical protein
MKRSIQRAAVLALAAIALCLGGCELKSLKIRIPDFDSKQVRGGWIYQLSENSREFEKMAHVAFVEPFDREGAEGLTYTVDGFVDAEGNQVHIETQVVRNPENPDQVTIQFWFPCDQPIVIKVSTYNAIGESPLSDETLYL